MSTFIIFYHRKLWQFMAGSWNVTSLSYLEHLRVNTCTVAPWSEEKMAPARQGLTHNLYGPLDVIMFDVLEWAFFSIYRVLEATDPFFTIIRTFQTCFTKTEYIFLCFFYFAILLARKNWKLFLHVTCDPAAAAKASKQSCGIIRQYTVHLHFLQ